MLHPWISNYKEMKIRREWGYSSSEDSLVIDDEIHNNTKDENSPRRDALEESVEANKS